MTCDIREPYILKAMGKACSHVIASKGYIGENERHDIADRIVAEASAGETNIERLVQFAVAPSVPEKPGTRSRPKLWLIT
ncbi:hypothetical protein [Taklimakanibacter deserti]|uniref:hypothetical protein n=1 Tax=Taklimakanibacter deserti TaxID=2267839 RepID=UPI000E646AD6